MAKAKKSKVNSLKLFVLGGVLFLFSGLAGYAFSGGLDFRNLSTTLSNFTTAGGTRIEHRSIFDSDAEQVKKYCAGEKFSKKDCNWACYDFAYASFRSDLAKHSYESVLCVQFYCSNKDKYKSSCTAICNNIDNNHKLCSVDNVEKYCQGKNFNEVKCSRYCEKISYDHKLCKKTSAYDKNFLEDERCYKYCYRGSGNFNEAKCNDECGGMFDRYNSRDGLVSAAPSSTPVAVKLTEETKTPEKEGGDSSEKISGPVLQEEETPSENSENINKEETVSSSKADEIKKENFLTIFWKKITFIFK